MSWGLKFFSEEDFETIDQVRNEIPDATEIKECEGGLTSIDSI